MGLVKTAARAPEFPAPLFCHLAALPDGDEFFGSRWPEARAIANPEGTLFDAFGLKRGRLLELFGPRVWLRGAAALLRGHAVGKPKGDPFRMPGAFLIEGSRILRCHFARHAGHHPKLGEFVRAD